jgi:hypothetical protein
VILTNRLPLAVAGICDNPIIVAMKTIRPLEEVMLNWTCSSEKTLFVEVGPEIAYITKDLNACSESNHKRKMNGSIRSPEKNAHATRRRSLFAIFFTMYISLNNQMQVPRIEKAPTLSLKNSGRDATTPIANKEERRPGCSTETILYTKYKIHVAAKQS